MHMCVCVCVCVCVCACVRMRAQTERNPLCKYGKTWQIGIAVGTVHNSHDMINLYGPDKLRTPYYTYIHTNKHKDFLAELFKSAFLLH